MPWSIQPAAPDDAPRVASLVQALLDEIMARTQAPHFDLDGQRTEALCRQWLADGTYTVLLCRDETGRELGLATLCESAALYVQGRFGIVVEFYVTPEARSQGVGAALMEAVCALGRERGWMRLELCTPPLPEFQRALAFYERQGFAVTGGRKVRRLLPD